MTLSPPPSSCGVSEGKARRRVLAHRSVAGKGEGGEEGEGRDVIKAGEEEEEEEEGKEGAERKRGRGEEKGKDIEKFFH